MIPMLKAKLIEGFNTKQDPFLFRRLALTAALLGITLFAFFAFILINYAKENYTLVIIDAVTIAFTLFSLYLLFVKKQIHQAGLLATSMLFIFLIVLSYLNKNHEFGLVWTLCFPLFVIPILGKHRGLIMIVLFYCALIPIVYWGIGEWDNGYWSFTSFMRFLVSSFTVVFIAYFFETSTIAAYELILKNRSNEIKYLEKLETLSVTDQLTGLYNRRYFDEQFKREQEKINRYGSQLCLIMMDLDHFKSINDRFGHQAGDKVLVEFSQLIKQGIRNTDILSRWGGEEFILLLPETSLANAAIMAEKLRVLVKENKFSRAEKVTASFGVAQVNKLSDNDRPAIQNADSALYQAKRDGRNRVVVYESTDNIE
jgi:diguanylate cyclase (GGDEF)-like protein